MVAPVTHRSETSIIQLFIPKWGFKLLRITSTVMLYHTKVFIWFYILHEKTTHWVKLADLSTSNGSSHICFFPLCEYKSGPSFVFLKMHLPTRTTLTVVCITRLTLPVWPRWVIRMSSVDRHWLDLHSSDPTMSPRRRVQHPRSNNNRVSLSVLLYHNYVQPEPMSPVLPDRHKWAQWTECSIRIFNAADSGN